MRSLRKSRRWTQAELARRLGLSQSRLSEVERGAGSFTAEQLLLILQLFNVPATHFGSTNTSSDSDLQNALARLGAVHLRESEEVLPSERFNQLSEVVRETLELGSPRLVAALGPVLVLNADRVRTLHRIRAKLGDPFLERRFRWLAENLLEAVKSQRGQPLSSRWRRSYQRASVVLQAYVDSTARQASESEFGPDRLLTSLQPEDFERALRAARVGD